MLVNDNNMNIKYSLDNHISDHDLVLISLTVTYLPTYSYSIYAVCVVNTQCIYTIPIGLRGTGKNMKTSCHNYSYGGSYLDYIEVIISCGG